MKWFLPILFLCFNFSATAQSLRQTTFDDRKPCEEVGGVWHEFGNSCANRCHDQFDKFSVCSRMTVNSCDCGKGRCWNGETCTFLKDYKKIYDQEQEETQKILNEAKERRKEALKYNQQEMMKDIIVKRDPQKAAEMGLIKAQEGTQNLAKQAVNEFKQVDGSGAKNKAAERQPITLMPFIEQKTANNTTSLFGQKEQSKQNNDSAITDLPSFPVIQVPAQ